MVDLPSAVADLVAAAEREDKPRALKTTVERVLIAFDEADDAARNAAIRTIGRGLRASEGRGAQILSLALGALVEGGASPDLTWPVVGGDLAGLLALATTFARAVLRSAGDENVETAFAAKGAEIAKKKPRGAAAWNALPSRCLASVACVTRSKRLRARLRKDTGLHDAAWPLSDAVAEVSYLLQALRIVDDESLLVLAPHSGRGFRLSVDELASNAELYILLADAVLGGPRGGRLRGDRPNPKIVSAIGEGTHPPTRAASIELPFRLVEWTSVGHDGAAPPVDARATDHVVWAEGIPWDIPRGPRGERIVMVQPAPFGHHVPIVAPFESLRPRVRIVERLSAEEVRLAMRSLGRAASSSKRAVRTPKKKSASKKKSSKARQ